MRCVESDDGAQYAPNSSHFLIGVQPKGQFVAGSDLCQQAQTGPISNDFVEGAYAASTGVLFSEDRVDGVADAGDSGRAIVAQGRRVFTAGTLVDTETMNLTVRADTARHRRRHE